MLVKWADSNVMHGWVHDDCKEGCLAHCETLGFLKDDDDEKVTVAMSISEFGSMLEQITIPRGCITSIKELRVK